MPAPALTIGNVAEATSMTVAALRSWETRYGFPAATRLPSGHRRYPADVVDQVLAVQRDRSSGLSLEAAIARVRSRDLGAESSLFAGVRRRRPDLPAHVLSRRAMLAISRAIEDECCSRAERPCLIGSFERVRFYRQIEQRWRELSRTARWAVVFADFPRHRHRDGVATEIAVARDDPLLREWAVVCDAPDAAACVVGVERPGPDIPGEANRFEAVWSVDPQVVGIAAEIGAAIATRSVPSLRLDVSSRPATDPAAALARAAAVTSRVVAYLDRWRSGAQHRSTPERDRAQKRS